MKITPWRLVLTGGAVLVLAGVGVGLASASPVRSPGPATEAQQAPVGSAPGAAPALEAADLDALVAGDPGIDEATDARAAAGALARLRQRFGPKVIHASWIVDRGDGRIVERQLDRGTIASITGSAITITEAGNRSVTVATGSATRVRKNRGPATVGDLKAGDGVVVLATVSGTTATANAIVVPAARPVATPAPTATP